MGPLQASTPAETAAADEADASAAEQLDASPAKEADDSSDEVHPSEQAAPAAAEEEQQHGQSAGPARLDSSVVNDTLSSLLTHAEHDSVLMPHGTVSTTDDSLPAQPADSNGGGLITAAAAPVTADSQIVMADVQPAMNEDDSGLVLAGEVDSILDDLRSTAGIPVQSADDSSTVSDAAEITDNVTDRQHADGSAVDTDSVVDRLMTDAVPDAEEAEPDQASTNSPIFL